MKKALKTAPRGTAFDYAGQRWVVLEHNATGTLCLTEKIVEDRAFDDGNCNDFSKSSSLRYLNGPFLDTLIDAAGCSSAFLTSELDLTTDDGLKAAFAPFGEVTAVRVVTDRMTGRSKGFGFVTMPDAAQAQAAIDALNGHELDGRTVRVNESQPKPREEREGGFRGGRGGFGGGRGGFRGGDRGPRRETRW